MAKQRLTIAAPAVRTADVTVTNINCQKASGIILVVDVTAVTANTLTVTLRGLDPLSGKTWTILASAALGVSTTILEAYPGTDEAANISENTYLPDFLEIFCDQSNASNITYSVAAILLP